MYLCCKKIREATDLRVLMTGEISDELFGYKYTDFAPSDEAFQGEAKKRVDEIHTYDVLRADRCIAANSMEGRVPFGDSDLVRYVMSIHPKWKRNRHGVGKYLLRKAFQGEGLLPDGILWRGEGRLLRCVGHSMVDDLRPMPRPTTPTRNSSAADCGTPTAPLSPKRACCTGRSLNSTIPARGG